MEVVVDIEVVEEEELAGAVVELEVKLISCQVSEPLVFIFPLYLCNGLFPNSMSNKVV